jgi:predicted transcriptional regulator
MLNKKEKYVLKTILDLSAGKSTCLLPPVEILSKIPYSINLTKKEFIDILKTLEYDGYLEFVESDSKGEKVLCITLSAKGLGFYREIIHYRRVIYFKLALTLVTAVLGFIITRILTML